MRLTRCLGPLLKTVSISRFLLPFNVTSVIRVRNCGFVSQNKFSCACQSHGPYIWLPHLRQFSADSISSSVDDSTTLPNGNVETKARKTRTLDQVVYHLQADIRRRRRIHKADIHNAIELIEKASRVENFGPFLINCCCDLLPDLEPTYRVQLAERIWTVIRKAENYSNADFESMLKVLALNEDKSLDPIRFLEEAKSFGLKVTGTMYFFAILIVCQRGDLEAAVEILNRMKKNNVPVNEKFFNALMIGNLRSGDLKGATDIVDLMRASGIEASLHTWNTLLQVHIETGNLEELQRTFEGIAGSQLTEDQYYELLKAAGRQNSSDIFDLVIKRALESQKIHALSIMNLSLQLMYLGYPKNALKMILQFENIFLQTKKESIGAFFIKELHSANMDENTYVELVTTLHGQSRNPYVLNLAAESCLKQNKFELAYSIFAGMLTMNVPVRPHYFLPAFIAEMQKSGTSGGIKVLKQMCTLKVQPDWEMLLNWIIPILFLSEQNLQETLKIIKETSGLSYSSGGHLSAGLIFAIQEGKLKEGVKVVQKLNGKVIYPEAVMEALLLYICDLEKKKDFDSIVTLVKFVSDNQPVGNQQDHTGVLVVKLLEADRCEEAEQLLKDLSKLRIPISKAGAEIVADKMNFTDNLEVDVNLTFQHCQNTWVNLNQMDLNALECHKLELESKDMNARGTSRKLFIKHCASEDMEKVIQSKYSFEKEFGPLTRGMKSALMGAYIRNEQLEPALNLFEELTAVSGNVTDVVVDVYKIIDLATLLAKEGRPDKAIELILEKCPTRRVHRPENISRNVVNLLDAIPDPDDVYNITELFLKLRFIKPTNPTLAPSVRALIKENKVEAAVERLEQYSEQYLKSPCIQEVTYAVLENPELLERVIKCSASTKGKVEARRLLALAKADVGDIDGAAKGFLELGSELRFDSILRQCEYLSSKEEIQKVLNMICALQRTGLHYDCKSLYDIAIQACKRNGNRDGLKQILCSMEEQDLYISPQLNELVKSS